MEAKQGGGDGTDVIETGKQKIGSGEKKESLLLKHKLCFCCPKTMIESKYFQSIQMLEKYFD
jgi:hypothetical protein